MTGTIFGLALTYTKTTNSITFCVYMLAENPHVLKKLRQEIHEKVGNRRPTYDDMREMKYLRAVINGIVSLLMTYIIALMSFRRNYSFISCSVRHLPRLRIPDQLMPRLCSPFNIRTSTRPVLLPSMDGGRPFYIPAEKRWVGNDRNLGGPAHIS